MALPYVSLLANNDEDLTSLTIRSKHLSSDTGLVEALQVNTTLTSLDISDCKFDPYFDYKILASLYGHPSLTFTNIYFADNSPAFVVFGNVTAKLIQTCTELQSLALGNMGVLDNNQAIGHALRDNTTLTSLDLSLFESNDAYLASLCRDLQFNTTLTHLGTAPMRYQGIDGPYPHEGETSLHLTWLMDRNRHNKTMKEQTLPRLAWDKM